MSYDRAYQVKYRLEHPEDHRAHNAKYRVTHQEEIRASNAKYRAEHPISRVKAAEYAARWRAKNPTYSSTWYTEHYEAQRDYMAKWRAEHRAEWCAIIANYKHRKRANGGNFSRAAWEHLKALFGHRCAYCGRRMKQLTQDHIVPVSKGGWHCSMNIVPACRSCNSRKGAHAVDRGAYTTVELRRREGQAREPVLLR